MQSSGCAVNDRQADDPWTAVSPVEAPLLSAMTLTNVWQFLKRSVWFVVGCVAVTLLVAAIYVLTARPVFVGSAQLLIEPQKQPFSLHESETVDFTLDSAQIESEVEVIKSGHIADAVIDELGLIRDPEFRMNGPAPDSQRRRFAMTIFNDRLTARRVGESDVVEIAFRSWDPARAAQITNAVANAYLRDKIETNAAAVKRLDAWMEKRIAELGTQLNTAARAVQQFKAQAGIVDTSKVNSQEILVDKLTELEARAQSYRKLYEVFLQRLSESLQIESFPVSNARIITAAVTPLGRSAPKTTPVMALATLLGLIGGLGISAVCQALDPSVRDGRRLQEATGLEVLGSLPRCPSPRDAGLAPGHEPLVDLPLSPYSNALRGVRAALEPSRRSGRRCIGISSLAPGQGKSTIAASLAAAYAISGAKVLLIDGDFRDPALSRKLAPHAASGLVQLLHGEILPGEIAKAVIHDRKTGAVILPLVGNEFVPDPDDLLGSAKMRTLLTGLRQSFDPIIIDLPAATAFADFRAIRPLIDGIILVAEWGRTPVGGLENLVDWLRESGVAPLGSIINKVEFGIPPPFGWRPRGRGCEDRRLRLAKRFFRTRSRRGPGRQARPVS
jgi:capsular exopolysaccharide synthesis family protein